MGNYRFWIVPVSAGSSDDPVSHMVVLAVLLVLSGAIAAIGIQQFGSTSESPGEPGQTVRIRREADVMTNDTIAGRSVQRTRPFIEESYGIPDNEEGLLTWEHVAERIAPPRNYWLSTVTPDGRPHAMPVWGVWLDDHLHFGGGPQTRKAKNLAVNPRASIHSEDGWDVVIIEGHVEEVLDTELQTRIDDVYEEKYGMRHGTPVWRVVPPRVFAWTDFPNDTTCWRFD